MTFLTYAECVEKAQSGTLLDAVSDERSGPGRALSRRPEEHP
jgi:hypothetical protein